MTDWIMIIITAIYVVATILICIFNAKSATAAKMQTEELKKQHAELYRPRIDIRFEIIRSGLLCFIVENIGTEPAINVNITLCKEFINNLQNDEDKRRYKDLSEATLYIASKQKITLFIDSQTNFKKISNVPAEFNVTYNNKYNEKLIIDISQYASMILYDSPLEDISQHLKQLKEKQISFQKNLLKQNITLSRVPVNVLSRVADDDDYLKFRVYKAVCTLSQAA